MMTFTQTLKNLLQNPVTMLLGALVLLALLPNEALAASQSGLAWEDPLETFVDSITGPVAGIVSLLAIVICGLMLVFGGEVSEFAKRMVYLILIIAIIVGAASLLNGLFNETASSIPDNVQPSELTFNQR